MKIIASKVTPLIMNKWQALSTRDKKIVRVGGAIIALFFLYTCLWQPLLSHVALLRAHIKAEQDTLNSMQAAEGVIKKMQTKAASQPLSLVERLSELQTDIQAARLSPYLTTLKQAADEQVALEFQNVDFDKLMSLLVAINKKQSLQITQFVADATASPGTTNVSMIIR